MKLLLASGNRHKVAEIKALLEECLGELFGRVELMTIDKFQQFPSPVEDGQTFLENALKKGRYYAERSGIITLADDSGLEVDALNGRPGIFSSRYAPTNPERISKLLKEMQDIPRGKRQARFVCVAVLVHPLGYYSAQTGYCYGEIGFEPRGEFGFGFDPVFVLPELGKTMAELPLGEKNKLSHRSRAIRGHIPLIQKLIDVDDENEDNIIRFFDSKDGLSFDIPQ